MDHPHALPYESKFVQSTQMTQINQKENFYPHLYCWWWWCCSCCCCSFRFSVSCPNSRHNFRPEGQMRVSHFWVTADVGSRIRRVLRIRWMRMRLWMWMRMSVPPPPRLQFENKLFMTSQFLVFFGRRSRHICLARVYITRGHSAIHLHNVNKLGYMYE